MDAKHFLVPTLWVVAVLSAMNQAFLTVARVWSGDTSRSAFEIGSSITFLVAVGFLAVVYEIRNRKM